MDSSKNKKKAPKQTKKPIIKACEELGNSEKCTDYYNRSRGLFWKEGATRSASQGAFLLPEAEA